MSERISAAGHPLSVVIAGGGTGGHLYPGIAVAQEIVRREPDARVSFAGTARGLEARVIPREGWPLDLIRSAGLKGKSIQARLRGALLIVPGGLDAWRLLSKRRPSVVIGVGGYSSGPVVLLAALRGIPTLVLEQNARPGLTNRLLARVASAAAVAYDDTLPCFHGKGFLAGNPVRAEFFSTRAESPDARKGRRRLLILGGSQGAHVVNLAAVAASADLARRYPDLETVHQTGERDLAFVRERYAAAGVSVRASAFLDPVVDEVMVADLVLSRAGATTLAELEAAGKPAVLVPFAAATDGHQLVNARVLERAGGAVIVEERDVAGSQLASVIGDLLGDGDRLARMGRAMHTLARPDAAARIVDRVMAFAGRPVARRDGAGE